MGGVHNSLHRVLFLDGVYNVTIFGPSEYGVR
jgi:hypothetical protein